MKNISLLLALSLFIISCSNSDDDSTGQDDPRSQASDYFPLTADSSWTYNNQSDEGTSRDSLYVAGTTTINANSYTNIDGLEPVEGLMTSTLANNFVRDAGADLFINGELSSPVPDFPVSIPLDDVVLYSTDAEVNTDLSSITDSFTQDIQGFPFTFSYTTSSVQLETLTSFSAGGQSFENVISSKIVVNLQVTVDITVAGTTLSIDVLTPQDAVVVTNYFAQDVGLIYSETLIDYQLEDLEPYGISYPFPSQVNTTATQSVDTYTIGE